MSKSLEHTLKTRNLHSHGVNCVAGTEFTEDTADAGHVLAPCQNAVLKTHPESEDVDEDFAESTESYRAKDVVISVSEYNVLRRKHRVNKALFEKYEGFSVEDLLREYHDKKTPKKEKQWLKEEVFLRTFFLLPYVAKKTYHITAAHFDDGMQNMASNLLTAIDKFKPELNYAFVDYLAAYLRAGVTKTFRDVNIVSIPSARRKLLRDAMLRMGSGAEEAVSEAVAGLAIIPVSYPAVPSNYDAIDLHDNRGTHGGGSHERENFDEIVHNLQLTEWLEEALSVGADIVTADERRVLVMHYGLFGHKPHTYKEIATLHKAEGKGHACSRLSQISTQATKKLRAFFRELGVEEY